MNIEKSKHTLTKLIKNRVKALGKADEELNKLEEFCEKHWSVTMGQTCTVDNLMTDDEIAESLNYGNCIITADRFIEIMNRAEKEISIE